MGDFRYAVRVLRKSPVFTFTAITTLALCIGANTAIYSVVDRVLLRPLPYPRPDRLALVIRHYQGAGVSEDDPAQAGVTWMALREHAASLDVAAFAGRAAGVNLVVGDGAEYVNQQRVSAGYFRVLGVAPAIGREISADEDRAGAPPVAVLSHAVWSRAFHADPATVGRTIVLRGAPHTVVGVMPAGFQNGIAADVWTPLLTSTQGEGANENYQIIARLKDGASWPEANAQVGSATAGIVRERYGRSPYAVSMRVTPLQRGQSADARRPLLILWAAVGVVLLIGCVNVAGLLLARGRARAPEIAMRMALGGGRAAIVRQLLVESLVLAVCGGVAGVAVGYAGAQSFAASLEAAFGVTGVAGLDSRILAMTAAIALGTSLVFGLVPALQASHVNLRETLVESGSASIAGAAHSWPRRALVVVEVALGVVLLVGAGLLARTFLHFVSLPGGFDAANVLTATFSLQDGRYQSNDRVLQLYDGTLDRMRRTPGVERAAVALTLPFERALNYPFRFVGGDQRSQMFNMTYVTPEYFDALRIPIVRGRGLTDGDARNAEPVIVVNEAFVRRYAPDADPLGRQVTTGGTARTIVGIAGDVQQKGSFGNYGPIAPTPASYIPAAQLSSGFFGQVHTWFSPSWIVRLAPFPPGQVAARGWFARAGTGQGAIAQMQQAARAVDPLLPFAKVRTLDDVRGEAMATQRAQAFLLGTLAALAVVLAGVGLYGLVATAMTERTRELGIRLALGATTGQAIVMAAAPGLALALVGVAVGLAAARAGSTVMRSLVYGVSTADPVTFALAAGVVLAVAVVATFVPALRIVRLNPIRALRAG